MSPRPSSPLEGSPEVTRVLAGTAGRNLRRWAWRALLLLAFAGAVGATLRWRASAATAHTTTFQTVPLKRGNLRVTVTATGTLEALNSVDVGAEITGRITEVTVQFNDQVKAGQVLAKIDTESYRAKVEEAQAKLMATRAALDNSRATASEARLKAERTERLHEQGLASDQDLETARAAYERAQAAVASDSAQGTLAQASLKVAQSSLDKTAVQSPIDGVVLDRLVEPGQTVTAGFQTPVLFTIAASLDAMRLDVAIDEADVGVVKEGQRASFSVDAFPNRDFPSRVLTVKNMPNTSSSVVTYTAWLAVDNSEHLLRPGMTATATITVKEEKNVLQVPNAAFRFTPPDQRAPGFSFAAIFRRGPSRSGPNAAASGEAANGSGKGESEAKRTLWILDGDRPRSVSVTAGATSGTETQVEGPDLTAGAPVIVNAIEAEK